MTPKLLIVDDDPKFRDYVARGLADSGVESASAADGEAALAAVLGATGKGAAAFDLILLDVMMPGQSGWDFLTELRGRGVDTPVIFVTARDAVDERIKGLGLGADDYIIKPFAFAELLARIDAVLRRGQRAATLSVGDLRIDLHERRVHRGERWIELSTREFDLLRALAEARGAVCSRPELLERVWGITFDPETNTVDVNVARLRRKLGKDGAELIQTVVGQGYRLAAPEEATS